MYFCLSLPLEKGVVLHLKRLEFPTPKDALCKVCMKLASVDKDMNSLQTDGRQAIRKARLSLTVQVS